ncbi:MAG TPA: phytanoyl-CoA dioxygenase family protein [Bryobacteraceae bacterium]
MRFWQQHSRGTDSAPRNPQNLEELRADRLLLAGLRIGIRETFDFLMVTQPSFEEFEDWVLAKNGGSIEPERVQRLNAALRGDGSFELESILNEAVLSPDDLAFWNEHGYVVVKKAVDATACAAAIDAIFSYARISKDDPDSWYGQQIWIPLADHPALWKNRNSPRIHTAFSQIWRRRDLWMNVDVCGVNPPVRPGYQFQGTPLHWDMTLAPPIRFGTQAILYLTDTTADQGAFSCVPGCHRWLEEWLRNIPAAESPREVARKKLQATPIAGDAGDLIIWHQALAHAATPNLGSFPRVVQYMNMFPSQFDVNPTWI